LITIKKSFYVHSSFSLDLNDLLLFEHFSSLGWHRPRFARCSVWCCRFAAAGGVPHFIFVFLPRSTPAGVRVLSMVRIFFSHRGRRFLLRVLSAPVAWNHAPSRLIFFSASFCSDPPPSPDFPNFLGSRDFSPLRALECATTNFGFAGPKLDFSRLSRQAVFIPCLGPPVEHAGRLVCCPIRSSVHVTRLLLIFTSSADFLFPSS
jgi:hypothetical protein